MTKKGRRRGNNKGRKANKPRFTDSGITTVAFSGQLEFNFSTGSGSNVYGIYPTAPGFCRRFELVGATFEYYRIVAFEYFLVPSTTRVSNEMFAHALLPQDSNTLTVANFGDLLQQPSAKIYDSRQVNIQKNRISRKALLQQPTKWWTTRVQTGTPDDFMQLKFAIISSAGAVSNDVMWYYKFIVQFRSVAVDFISLSPPEEEKKHVEGCQCTKCLKNQ